jgi:hypothetical protein
MDFNIRFLASYDIAATFLIKLAAWTASGGARMKLRLA